MSAMVGSSASSQPRAFEVSTTSADALRASIRVFGTLTERTCPLLFSVVSTHLRAGRRYLRVNLADARVDDLTVLAPMAQAHGTVAELGGMLVFDNADAEVARALTGGDLFVSS